MNIQMKLIRKKLKVMILAKGKLWLRTATQLSFMRIEESRLDSLERLIDILKLGRAAMLKPLLKSQ